MIPKDTSHALNSSPGVRGTLHLDNVKLWALQEYYEPITVSDESQRASFQKYDSARNQFVIINVYCKNATAGICLEHPRLGKTQVFCRQVDEAAMRRIFQNPRECVGYPSIKKGSG